MKNKKTDKDVKKNDKETFVIRDESQEMEKMTPEEMDRYWKDLREAFDEQMNSGLIKGAVIVLCGETDDHDPERHGTAIMVAGEGQYIMYAVKDLRDHDQVGPLFKMMELEDMLTGGGSGAGGPLGGLLKGLGDMDEDCDCPNFQAEKDSGEGQQDGIMNFKLGTGAKKDKDLPN